MATKILSLDGLNDATLCGLISQLLKTIPGVTYANIDFLSQRLTLELEGREASAVVEDAVRILRENIPHVTIKQTEVGTGTGSRNRVPVPEINFGRYAFDEDDDEYLPDPEPPKPAPQPEPEEKPAEQDTAPEEEIENHKTISPNVKHFLISLIVAAVLFGLSYIFVSGKALFQIGLGLSLLISAISSFCLCTGTLQKKTTTATAIQLAASTILFFTGDPSQATAAMLLYQISLFLVYSLYQHIEDTVEKTVDINPDRVSRLDQDALTTVPLGEILPGHRVILKKGMSAPFECKVIEGKSMLDCGLLTGDSQPVPVGPGTLIACGDRNLEESLIVEVIRLKSGTTAAKMYDILQDGQIHETDTVWHTRKRVILFTLLELVAVLVVTMWQSVNGSVTEWLHKVIAMLLLSAPCGLTAAVHGAQLAGLCNAIKKGIIIRTGTSLENICKVKTAILEFSGMLTKNEYHLVDIWKAEGIEEGQLLALAAAVENGISHPIARAILAEYYKHVGKDGKLLAIDLQEQAKGYGVRAMIDRKMMLVGSEKFMRDADIEVPPNKTGLTCVYITERGEYIGALLLEDPLRAEAEGIGSRLRAGGMESVGILTGCDSAVARPAGDRLGVDMAYFEKGSQDKIVTLDALIQKESNKKQLLFAGGVQDEDLFVLPCTRIAMGQDALTRLFQFTDAVIPSGELNKLDEAITISREAQGTAEIAFNFYVTIKILLLAGAIFWSCPLALAAVANGLLTLLLPLNTLRRLRAE